MLVLSLLQHSMMLFFKLWSYLEKIDNETRYALGLHCDLTGSNYSLNFQWDQENQDGEGHNAKNREFKTVCGQGVLS